MCFFSRQNRKINLEDEFNTFEVYRIIEEIFDIQDLKEAVKMQEQKAVKMKLVTDKEDLQYSSHIDEHSESEETKSHATKSESYLEELNPYALALPFKNGAVLETFSPENSW